MSEPVHYPRVNSTSSLAIVSLVFGVLAWCVLPFAGAIVAIVCGHMARSEIRRAEPTAPMEGNGLAIAGLVLGYVQLAMIALGLLGFFALVMLGVAFSGWH